MSGDRWFAKQSAAASRAAPPTNGRIVSVTRIGTDGAECVRVQYRAHQTRFLTRKRAEHEPEVWALCTWWHTP